MQVEGDGWLDAEVSTFNGRQKCWVVAVMVLAIILCLCA